MNNFSCFYDYEIKKIYEIYQKVHQSSNKTSVEDMYKELLSKASCNEKDKDKCIYKYLEQEISSLPKEYKEQLDKIYFSAKPIQDKPQSHQWLDNFIIVDGCYQFQLNSKQNYKFGGIALYDDFEYALTDNNNKLSPSRIIKQLKENIPKEQTQEQDIHKIITDGTGQQQKVKQRKSKIGFVLNTCHKYSSGLHWVAMGFTYFPDKNRIDIDYFDSQGDYGFETQELNCDTTSQEEKYKHYKPKANEWLEYFKKVAKQEGIKQVFYTYNKFYTQSDDYSCGYHAMLFNYLLSRIDEPIQMIYLLVQTEQGKNLDKFVLEMRDTMYGGQKKKEEKGFREIIIYTY